MEKLKAEASGFIYEAAKHADNESYGLALNNIDKAIEKIYRLSPKTCKELKMIKDIINKRIVSEKNRDKQKPFNHLGDWLEKTACGLNGYYTMRYP